MYAVLKCRIEIGGYVFDQVNDVVIERSIDSLSDKAVLKMPASFLLGNKNGGFERKVLENSIKPGDPVSITLGYDGIYSGKEFEGFVKSIKPNTPLVIECEDSIYLLRQKSYSKNFRNTSLKEILMFIVEGTGLELSGDIPDVKFDKFLIKNINGALALQRIKDEYGLSIYIDNNGKLFGGLRQQQNQDADVSFDLRKKTKSNLIFRSISDRKIKVKAIGVKPDNKRIEVEAGDASGEQRTLHFYNITDKEELRRLAEEKLGTLKFDGYDGNVVSYLVPYSDRGMAAIILDSNHPEREGRYFVEKVVTAFNPGTGARRKTFLGAKLS